MSLFPSSAMNALRAASDEALVDACAFALPATGGTYDPVTRETTGGTAGTAYAGPCKAHDALPKSMRGGVAEGSPMHRAEGWLRLPRAGSDALPSAAFAAFRERADAIEGTVTTERGLTLAFTGVGLQDRATHARLFVRFTGAASAS